MVNCGGWYRIAQATFSSTGLVSSKITRSQSSSSSPRWKKGDWETVSYMKCFLDDSVPAIVYWLHQSALTEILQYEVILPAARDIFNNIFPCHLAFYTSIYNLHLIPQNSGQLYTFRYWEQVTLEAFWTSTHHVFLFLDCHLSVFKRRGCYAPAGIWRPKRIIGGSDYSASFSKQFFHYHRYVLCDIHFAHSGRRPTYTNHIDWQIAYKLINLHTSFEYISYARGNWFCYTRAVQSPGSSRSKLVPSCAWCGCDSLERYVSWWRFRLGSELFQEAWCMLSISDHLCIHWSIDYLMGLFVNCQDHS